jgi:hypothetical protein
VSNWDPGAAMSGHGSRESRPLPPASCDGSPFPDIICLSAVRGLLVAMSSLGHVALWDIQRYCPAQRGKWEFSAYVLSLLIQVFSCPSFLLTLCRLVSVAKAAVVAAAVVLIVVLMWHPIMRISRHMLWGSIMQLSRQRMWPPIVRIFRHMMRQPTIRIFWGGAGTRW